MERLRSDDEIHDCLQAYHGLKDGLLGIKIIHIRHNDIHEAVKLIDKNIISISNQMGLINYFLGNYTESLRLCRESNKMYPRGLRY
ncbi:MAG: hypothetical protein MUC95_04740 [Spirochaetes bacterium]|nr:hypothetical protein [Spirochaetota bacterium]